MKLLKDLLYRVPIQGVVGATGITVAEICFDSRKVDLNDVFVAVRGTMVDGHHYIKQACDQGAIAIICEELPQHIINGITYVTVTDATQAMAYMADNFYDHPSAALTLVGVTGTNGKTTVATLLYDLFTKLGHQTGLLSTVVNRIGAIERPATHTTPDSLTINKLLRTMLDHDVTHCFMEASSHGIDQNRTLGLTFAGGIFTNLSHDHLDYHHDFKSYRDVKKRLFDQLPQSAFALVNLDDKNGAVMLQNTKASKVTYAQKSLADYKVNVLERQLSGQLIKINQQEVWVKLIGAFNAYNLLAIYACADLLKQPGRETLRVLSTLESVSGRFQYFISSTGVTAIVDYAHTPDALDNVLSTINDLRTGNESLITVVGCGGDRDPEKRPKMGAIAASWSSKVIFTNDNPRNEDPQLILQAIEAGVAAQDFKKYVVIADRAQAIKTAVQMAAPKDIILIAGKGHETYQEIKGQRFDFNDLEIVTDLLTN